MDTRALFQSSAEHPEPQKIPIQGNLPEWFQGTYYSVGNGLFDLPSGFTVNHCYDGYAILYSIQVANKKEAVVMSKFLDSDAYKRAIAKGQPVFHEFGTVGSSDPDKGFFSRVISQLVPVTFTDNDFMNLIILRGRLFAVSETCLIHQLNPNTLQSIQKVDLLKTFGFAYLTAHPIYDDDGSTYCLTCSVGTTLKYNIIQFLPAPSKEKNLLLEKIDMSSNDIKVIASIPSSWKTCLGYMHSFAMSPNYFIIYEQPFRVNNLKILTSHFQGRAMKESFEWHPDEQLSFILIERSTGNVLNTKYLAPTLFITHVLNAYEENGHIIVDLIGRKTAAVVDHLTMECLRENKFSHNDPPHVYRFVLPIVKNFEELRPQENIVTLTNAEARAEKRKSCIFCTPTIIGESGFDFPTRNPNYTGKKYRYVFGTGYFEDESVCKRAICKLDLSTGETQYLRVEESQSLSEPYFVLRPEAEKEDDGLLVVSMSETQSGNPSAIIYVDASTFQEVARVNIPYKIAHIQHGIFLPLKEITEKES